MTTQSMDERIRAKAKLVLEAEIEKTLAPLYDKMRGMDRNRMLTVTTNDGDKKVEKRIDVWCQLREVQTNLEKLFTPAACEAAVAEFIAKVESLQEQIDSLSIQQ
jgi:hypothetical protein